MANSLGRCQGTVDNHCCWMDGKECPNLIKRDGDIICGPRERQGSWEAARKEPAYVAVQDRFREVGIKVECGDWPPEDKTCNACGTVGIEEKIRKA